MQTQHQTEISTKKFFPRDSAMFSTIEDSSHRLRSDYFIATNMHMIIF